MTSVDKRALALQWINALRGGEYKPSAMQLRNKYTNGFCCLGVLCDIYNENYNKPSGKEGWIQDGYSWRFHDLAPGERNKRFTHSAHRVPESLHRSIGLNTTKGILHPENFPDRMKALLDEYKIPYRDRKHLASLNDQLSQAGLNPFPIIAELIEYALTHHEVGVFSAEFYESD